MMQQSPARAIARGAIAAMAVAIASVQPARATDIARDIAGPWLTAKHDSIVSFAPCGPGWCGNITKVLRRTPGGPTTDVRNPDPALRNRPIEGLQLIKLDRFEGAAWRGTVYDPRSGQSYKVYVRRAAPGQVEVKGCLFFVCEAQQWTVP
ncbi:DUF2147 domain-containing protein [Novosphingobium sp.]|uniref:DUF2147 domain-containing protein n=1 Tax=Novosphingobium sp. TaxID=1874826 RepID=UPI003341D82B